MERGGDTKRMIQRDGDSGTMERVKEIKVRQVWK